MSILKTKIKNTCTNAQIVCKMNDVSHDFNFQKGNLIYVTHITPLKAVILFNMLLLCSLGIQLANYIRNLNN